jgi:hypothetical protein
MCAACLATAGCGDTVVNSGVVQPGSAPAISRSDAASDPAAPAEVGAASPQPTGAADPAAQEDPSKPRTFAEEGPEGAVRITFGDLDLQKLLNMNVITSDCVSKMPDWLTGLAGKKVRVRGFMKPGNLTEGIPQFVFVRSTDLCCFEPRGRVDHLIATTLKAGTTTDYIALKPFDVVGTFRVELVEFDDGLIILLYHIDDATIIRN